MITFLTVLKSNKTNEFGKFGHSTYLPEHVYSLQSQIKKHYNKPHKFYCLTDYPDLECEMIPLILDLPGWWSKIELFRQTGNIIYFDLDTVILDDITEFVEYLHDFSALADIHHNSILPGRLWSGIMAWSGDHSDIYNKCKTCNNITEVASRRKCATRAATATCLEGRSRSGAP